MASTRAPQRPPAGQNSSSIARGVIELVCFLSEIAMLVLLAVSGWDLGDGGLLGLSLAVLYPALAVVVWSLWMAPNAEKRLPDPWRFIVQVLLFGATTAAAVAADKSAWGIVFACVAVPAFALSRVAGGPTGTPGGRQAGSSS